MLDTTKRVLDFIDGWELPYPPSQRDIAQAVGISQSTVNSHLEILSDMGLISYHRNIARTTIRTDKERPE